MQNNKSMSSYGVMRGLHFQRPPFTQSKLVRCVKGAVLDVAVDIRKGSPTYGQHVAVEPTEDNHRQFFVPRVIGPSNYSVRKNRLFNDVYDIKKLKQELFNANADIIHINGYTSMCTVQAFRLAHKMNKKIVYTAHWHPFKYLRRPVFGKLFFSVFLKPLISRYADCVVAINNEDYAYFKSFCNNVIQIPHWMRLSIDSSFNTSHDKVKNMILFVGRVDGANKGIHHLYHLPEGKYDIHCVGEGTMKERSDIHHHVNITNEEQKNLYKKASLLVVPSTYEAFSYAALEALYCGTPVVLSKGVRIADYLGNEDYCTVFDYGDINGFCSAVEKTIGKAVDIEYIHKLFDKQRAMSLYKKMYLSLA